MRRMDRYKDSSEESRVSRANQNKELYETIGSNTRYTNFSDVTNANAIDLSSTKNYRTREGYHQMKEYQDVVPTPRVKKELEEFKNIYQDRENRVYDINNVLEEARKNRLEKDELEEKRKLKNTSYNILANLNPEELEKYRQEKKDKIIHPDDEELRELIDTITSKTLAGDIQAASSLLSDLMATSIMDKVSKPEPDEPEPADSCDDTPSSENTTDEEDPELSLSKEILDLEELKKYSKITIETESSSSNQPEDSQEISAEDKTSSNKLPATADEDFYTRSMDLSEQDFDFDDEFKEKKLPIGIKILIFLIILVVLAAVFYFIWKQI